MIKATRYFLVLIGVASVATGFAFRANKGNNVVHQPVRRLVLPAVGNATAPAGIAQLIKLANEFKATLTPDQLALAQLPYSVKDAEKWSNFPQAFSRGNEKMRVGLGFGAMTPAQILAAETLLKAAAGNTVNEGWDELQQLMNADDYLKANGGGNDYGAGNYYIALLGTPGTTGTFEIQFGGHHMAFANTYKNGVLSGATPSFRGVEPFNTFTINNKTNQPIQQEQVAFSAILTSLTGEQLASAKLSRTFGDLLLGPHNDGAFPATASGIACSALSKEQKALILKAIATYVDDIADPQAIMAKYTKELDQTYLSYSGTTSMLIRNDYIRLDGPSLWLEYSCQGGIVLPGTHPHSVWRDKKTDYGGN